MIRCYMINSFAFQLKMTSTKFLTEKRNLTQHFDTDMKMQTVDIYTSPNLFFMNS